MRHASPLSTAFRVVGLAFTAWPLTQAATLPVPCVTGSCLGGRFGTTGFVSSGQATAVTNGSKLTVNQSTANATLNWQSFNISADGAVQFIQPGLTAVALNQINDANPSQIFGSLSANGRVFLINQNGIIFGAGAQINVGGLLASTLNIDPVAASSGLIAAGSAGNPAFQAFATGSTGGITIGSGATLQTSQGGSVLLFAPEISNQGTISTPGGQTLLAAGSTIYLASSSAPEMRGLLVEVGGTGGTVTNGDPRNATVTDPTKLVGQILATDGNITLAGLAVNQLGRVSATTSINENGSIRLQAGDHGGIYASGVAGVSGGLQAGSGGQLTLGKQSVTDVLLDSADTATTVDSVPQLKSDISLSGDAIQMLAGSVARATSGTIEIQAAQGTSATAPSRSDGSRFYLAAGAELDVSGASITRPVSSNVIAVQLRGAELANSPLQQNGPLRGQTVYVDIRQEGPLVNGVPSWVGTPLADISGEIAAMGHTVTERNLAGGSISILSHGDAILAPGSTVNVSGGRIQYTGGYLNTTNLLAATGQTVNIVAADPNLLYLGIANSTTLNNVKWGTSSSYTTTPGTYSAGYVEGKDAGSLTLAAPSFVLDSAAMASTVAGIYQRLPDAPVLSGQLYRDPHQLPKAATLQIGTPGDDFVVGNLTIAPAPVLPSLTNADGSAFDPTVDPLPLNFVTSFLRPVLLGSNGFGNVNLYTNGQYLQPATASLAFAAGGSFAVHASLVDIEGSIDVPGGSITAVAQPTLSGYATAPQYALTLGPQALLTARGAWVNDSPLLNATANSAPLVLNGGSVSLSVVSNDILYSPGLLVDPGSRIDVSGGAQLTSGGKLVAGKGGAINLSAQTTSTTLAGSPPRLSLGGSLSGYGLFSGGSLTLATGGVCIASAACSGGDPSVLWVTPKFLQQGGFGSYSLLADQGGLTVAPGTTLVLQQQNLSLPANAALLPSRASLTDLAGLTLLPSTQRNPVNLALNQYEPLNSVYQQASTLLVDRTTPYLLVGQGALIQGDPGAQLSLSSNVRLDVEGELLAPGGSISLALSANQLQAAYTGIQGIWLGGHGVLDAAGSAQVFLDGLGRRSGAVLGGGTVNLTASRGYIELSPGSRIDVSGTSATLDISGPGAANATPEQVASAGGALNLLAAEGVQLDGSLQGAAGIPGNGLPQPPSGSFSLTLDGRSRDDYATSFGGVSTFSTKPRQILVSATQAPAVTAPGSAVPDSRDGNAYLSTTALAAAGFGSVALKAAPLPMSNNTVVPGSIDFVGDVTLAAAQQLTLDAASYAVSAGSTAQLRAPDILFGNSDQVLHAVPVPTGGTGQLLLNAGFLELYGDSALQGIGSARFDSTGDLRLRGLLDLSSFSSTAYAGSLHAAGDLEFSAQQIYPTTLSQFTLSTDPSSLSTPISGTIVVNRAPGSAGTLLSAGGALTLSAGTVMQNGVLRAPFGTIDLTAPTLTLGAGSLTSTSANGLTIPFGTTQGGLDWVYPLQNGNNLVYGTGGVAPPSQHITLQGAQVSVRPGAVIDVSGGGDLQAYEWIPGTGGTTDVLSQSIRPGQYAILPGLHLTVAPYDPASSTGSALQVGQSVYLAGAPGLAAGTYTLLPARYALLPGAFLVTAVDGYQDLQPGQSFQVSSGGSIVSGYATRSGSGFASDRYSGFQVVPAAAVLQQAQYTLTSANRFFAGQASAAATDAPRLPQDSGVLALVASNALTLGGTLHTTAASGGIGGEVDISSSAILVAPSGTATQSGEILLTPDSLNALGAQTLLLGGLRNAGAIDTRAQSIEIAGGATIVAPVVELTAQQSVTVDSGASLTATGAAPAPTGVVLDGDGAFLSVSTGKQIAVTRSNASGSDGVLNLSSGSTLTATNGSVYLEATNSVLTNGALSLSGSDLAVQSPGILLGSVPAGMNGTVLGSSVLGAEGLRNLLLQSGTSIGVYGAANLNAQNIAIDAAGLSGQGGVGDTATLNAVGTITLSNHAMATSVAGSGVGKLAVNAANVALDGGDFTLSGFSASTLNASTALTGTANGSLSTIGDLSVLTPRVTTNANTSLALGATGAVTLTAPAQPATAAAGASLGGALAVSGSQVTVGTTLDLPSGRISLDSTSGDLVLTSTGKLDTAGTVQSFAGVPIGSTGGTVLLQSAGNIDLSAGQVDVSGGVGASGGALSLFAPGGAIALGANLQGNGQAGQGATVAIDGQALGDFASLNARLNAGGFSGGRAVRLRGPGDLVLASGNSIDAQRVSLETDQGGITINGAIDASGVHGGTVTLAASGDVTVNGRIAARATGSDQSGGQVALETTGGRLLLNSGSSLDVRGAGSGVDGTLLLRAPAATVSAVASGGNGVVLDGAIVGSSRTTLEGFNVYQNTTGRLAAADVAATLSNAKYADATAFMANAGAIAAVLGQSSNANLVVTPGIEIDASTAFNGSGTLTLASSWNLYNWRFGAAHNIPGILTLRAQNGITIAAALSDGFTATSGTSAFTLPATNTDSWSYRIAAGADLSAANPLVVDPTSHANMTIAPCVGIACTIGSRYAPNMIRTGNGFIDVAASGNFILGSQQSVLYTAGVAGSGIRLAGGRGGLGSRAYPTAGGDIQLSVGGDIVGAPSNQFVSAWLWRVGAAQNSPQGLATAWTVDYQSFQQGIAALGGGNVTVQAGGNISDFSASIPTIGVQTGGTTQALSVVQIRGGGNLAVTAGRSILGGSYYVGAGTATLQAGNDIGASLSDPNGLSPLIGLGDTAFSATARGNLQLSGIINPTLLNRGQLQGAGTSVSYFSTYGSQSAATLTAVGGNLVLDDESSGIFAALSPSFLGGHVTDFQDSPVSFNIVPPTLNLYALSGDADISRVIALSPSNSGNLQIFANRNVIATPSSNGTSGQIIVPDVGPGQLPTPTAPQSDLQLYTDIASALVSAIPDQHSPTPAFAGQGATGIAPVRVVALGGDVVFQPQTNGTAEGIWSGKPVQISAGRDVIDLNLVAQNLSSADVTSVTAGRDILYPQQRNAYGGIVQNTNGVVVDGPGLLQLSAGRNVDLGTANGLSTRANLLNPVLPASGASISVQAGVAASAPQYAAFIQQYIEGSSQFDSLLVDFMQSVTGQADLSTNNAKQAFATLAPHLQQSFVETLFFGLLRHYGRLAAASGNGDFSGAFAAISTLYPGANPNLAKGQVNPYSGNLELYFSRIYTQQGGNISLLAPGGEINVGLALAPASFGLNKAPDQLGIVAETTGDVNAFGYNDFQVNQSRVFAADGGNVLVWTTEGNIDAGRGAKTAISAPALNIAYDPNGQPTTTLRAAVAGSGIQALSATRGVSAGDVDLFAPHGVVNANDAGIVAGNLTVAATAVLGAGNISVSGTSVGVPVTVTGLGASFAGAASTAGATTNSAESYGNTGATTRNTPLADATISYLDVFVTGLGEQNCRPDDLECIKREQ